MKSKIKDILITSLIILLRIHIIDTLSNDSSEILEPIPVHLPELDVISSVIFTGMLSKLLLMSL